MDFAFRPQATRESVQVLRPGAGMSKDERIRQDLREQNSRDRLKDHAVRLEQIIAEAELGASALDHAEVVEPAIRQSYSLIIAEATEAKRLINERLAKGKS
jgi:hypothetical protein